MINENVLIKEIQEINNNFKYNNVKRIIILADMEYSNDSYSMKIISDAIELSAIFKLNIKIVSQNTLIVKKINNIISEFLLPLNLIEFSNWNNLSFLNYDIIICTIIPPKIRTVD